MVDQTELFRIADRILADGKMPSVRSVRAELSKGGSFSDVGPMFVEWSLSRGFRPRPTKDDLPPRFQEALGKLAAEIWCHGRDQGRVHGRNEHDRLVVERDSLRLAFTEVAARADALEERLYSTERSEITDDDEGGQAPGRREKIAFWNRLMQEIADLIGDQQLNPEVVFRLLGDETHREAGKWVKGKTWSASLLADKMKGRAEKGNFFAAAGSGLYRRLGGADVSPLSEVAGSPGVDPIEAAAAEGRPASLAKGTVRASLRDLARRVAGRDDDDTFPDEAA